MIPCSGIGKVHGLLTREATYLVTDEMAPEQTETMCLGLLVKGDAEAVEAVKTQTCITIDGCPKTCAEKNVKIAGGNPVGPGYRNLKGASWRQAWQSNRTK